MKQIEQPGDTIANVAQVIQLQSPTHENRVFVPNSRNLMFKQRLRAETTGLSEGVPISENSCLLLRPEQRETETGPRRVDEVGPAASRSYNMSDATVMLAAIEAGDSKAADQLLVIVYDELRRLAAAKLAQEAPGQTLQPTALVHEAWLQLVGDKNPSFKDREHFFRASAEAMRHILIDRARRKRTKRHGGGCQRVDFEGFDLAAPIVDDQLLAVNEALDKFATEHPVQADLVKLRYFAGMTNEEVSQVLGISLSTVKNYWTFSRAWLLNEIESNP